MRSKWVWLAGGIGLAVILVAIIGGAAWFLFGGDNEAAAVVTSAPTAVADVAPAETATATAMPVEDSPPAGEAAPETEATATSLPTSTPVDAPSPTFTPMPVEPTLAPVTPPPAVSEFLFEDDFEIKNEAWNTDQTTSFNLANGEMLANGTVELTVGDQSWTNYRVSIELGSTRSTTNLTLLTRVQDADNYLIMECVDDANYIRLNCAWAKVTGGIRGGTLLGTEFRVEGDRQGRVTVEIAGDAYRVNALDDVRFIDAESPFLTGGIKFIATGQPLSLDNFKVEAIP